MYYLIYRVGVTTVIVGHIPITLMLL